MCGIIGQFAFGEQDTKLEKVRQESMIFLGSELLQLTQDKGRDATGVSLLFDDGNYHGLKMCIPSTEFVSNFGQNEKEYGGFIKVWRESKKVGRVFIGHCRAITRGTALDNNNNHPIKVGNIVGIHNGTIQNDDAVFKNLDCERLGDVDSEAIFRLLHHYTKNGTEPFTMDIIKETVQRLAGKFAVLSYSGNNPYQACAFRDRKPVEMALVKPLKMVICATEKKFIEIALYRYNKHVNLYLPGKNFPTIIKSDVEYKTLMDNSAVIFDLTTEIGEKTTLDDLYDWDKLPRTRLWGEGTGNNYEKLPQKKTGLPGTKPLMKSQDPVVRKPATGGTGENAGYIPKETKKKDKEKPVGRVWLREINGYAASNSPEVKRAKEFGNVEIDVMKGTCEELEQPEEVVDGEFQLKTDDVTIEGKGDALEGVEINDLSLKNAKHVYDDETNKDTDESTLNETELEGSTIEVDVHTDPEALEAAEESAKKVQQYENIDEVLADLEIEDATTLEQIPIASLINRIQKFVYKRGVYEGYIKRKRETQGTNDLALKKRMLKKKLSAERKIRALKTMVKLLLRGLNERRLEFAVNETMNRGEEISYDALDRLFSAGDEREFRVLSRIKYMIGNKEHR